MTCNSRTSCTLSENDAAQQPSCGNIYSRTFSANVPLPTLPSRIYYLLALSRLGDYDSISPSTDSSLYRASATQFLRIPGYLFCALPLFSISHVLLFKPSLRLRIRCREIIVHDTLARFRFPPRLKPDRSSGTTVHLARVCVHEYQGYSIAQTPPMATQNSPSTCVQNCRALPS